MLFPEIWSFFSNRVVNVSHANGQRRSWFHLTSGLFFPVHPEPSRRARRCGVIIMRRNAMLYYALVFLVVALIAGVLGFGGIAGASAGIAKILFLVFIVLFLISLVSQLFRRA